MRRFKEWFIEREQIDYERMLEMLLQHFNLPLNKKEPGVVPLENLDLKYLQRKIDALSSDMVTADGKQQAIMMLQAPGNHTLGDLARKMIEPPFRPSEDNPPVAAAPGAAI